MSTIPKSDPLARLNEPKETKPTLQPRPGSPSIYKIRLEVVRKDLGLQPQATEPSYVGNADGYIDHRVANIALCEFVSNNRQIFFIPPSASYARAKIDKGIAPGKGLYYFSGEDETWRRTVKVIQFDGRRNTDAVGVPLYDQTTLHAEDQLVTPRFRLQTVNIGRYLQAIAPPPPAPSPPPAPPSSPSQPPQPSDAPLADSE